MTPEEIARWIKTTAPEDEITAALGEDLKPQKKIEYSVKPVDFMERTLGLTLWEKQAVIANSVKANPMTVVESAHSTGKSFLSAALACHWMCTHKPAAVIIISPTHNQLNNILWRYVRQFVRGHSLPGEVFETPRWTIDDDVYAIGLSPKKATQEDMATLQGYHSEYLLIILDEAAGLPRILWQAVRNLATYDTNRILAIGNPIAQSGPFWDACNSPSWKHIHMSALEHPNVVEGKNIIPGAVSRSWVEGMIADHTQKGNETHPDAIKIDWLDHWIVPDPVFKARVMGVAPGENDFQLITYAMCENAKELDPEPMGEIVLGIDPARTGGDYAALVARQGPRLLWIKRRKPTSKNPGFELAHWLKEEAEALGVMRIFVEESGLGASVVDAGRHLGLPIVGIYPSGAASNRRRFHNLRAEMYWRVREALREQIMNLPDDDLLIADLASPEYGFDLYGKIQIEKKEDIAKRIGRSPDSADALALTFAVSSLAGLDSAVMSDAVDSTRLVGGSRWHVPVVNAKTNRWINPSRKWSVARRGRR